MAYEITIQNRHEVCGPKAIYRHGRELLETPGNLGRRPFSKGSGRRPKASDFLKPIPRNNWKDAIAAGAGSFLHDLCKAVLPPHDQGRTNYCWAHGSVRAVETLRVFEGQEPKLLSAESVAVPITNGRNIGGYAEDALDQLAEFGACEQRFWPNNDLRERMARNGWKDDRLKHRVVRWVEVDSFDLQITLALMRVPVALGLDWWGHLVCQLDPVIMKDGSVGIGIDNSWGNDFGDNGYGTLDEASGTGSSGCWAPMSINFSL